MTDALITHPVLAGSGRRLFEPGDPHTRLELVDSAVSSRVDMADRSRLRWLERGPGGWAKVDLNH